MRYAEGRANFNKAQDQDAICWKPRPPTKIHRSGEEHEAAEAALGVTTEKLADLMVERDPVEASSQGAGAARGQESKFARLLETMREPQFADEKMLIFTEHRDTANYLTDRLEAIGYTGQVAQLHGAMDYRSATGRWNCSERP